MAKAMFYVEFTVEQAAYGAAKMKATRMLQAPPGPEAGYVIGFEVEIPDDVLRPKVKVEIETITGSALQVAATLRELEAG